VIAQFFRNSAVYGIAGILSRGINVILVPIYTRYLSPHDYGALDILIVFATLANYVVAMEISQGVARFYSEAKDKKNKAEFASTALWFAALAYTIFVIISLNFSAVLSDWIIGVDGFQEVFQISVVAIAMNGIFYLLQDLLRWQFQPFRYSIASLVYTISGALIAIYLVTVQEMGVAGIFYGQVIGAIVGIIYSIFSATEAYGRVFSWDKCKVMLGYSFPLVFTSIAYYFSVYVDRVAIKELMTLSDVGVYGVGARIASVSGLLMIGFQSALTPLIYHNYEKQSTPSDLARIFKYFLAIALPFILGVSLFSKELVWIFTTPEYYLAWTVIPILSCSILLATMYIFAPGLFIRKKTMQVALIHLVALVINVGLNLLFIPILGIVGAAVATLISTAVTFLIYMWLSQSLYNVPHNWKTIALALAIFIATIFAVQINSTLVVQLELRSLFLHGLILLISACAIVYTLLGRGEILALFNKIRSKLSIH